MSKKPTGDGTPILPSKDQFQAHVEAERAKDAELHTPTEYVEPAKPTKDITILATAFQRASEYYKDLVRDAESPAMRWYAKGSAEAYGFVASRIREMLDPTVTVKPELADSAIEATYQANIAVMRAMDGEKKNGNGQTKEPE